MWKDGVIQVEGAKIKYNAKVYDEPSIHGINDGRISKLFLEESGDTIAAYDRGWDIKSISKAATLAVAILLYKFK